jgi:hypothetical protein
MPKPKNPNSKRILCVCRGGASRSVGIRNVLAWGHGHDAIAAGFEGNTPETLKMLCDWAEIIVVARNNFIGTIDIDNRFKVRVCELGEDVYFNPNSDLYEKCGNWVNSQEDLKLWDTFWEPDNYDGKK